MNVRITDRGVSIDLSCGEAVALVEQLGDMPAKNHPKVRQLHSEVETALKWRDRGAARQATGGK